MKEMYGKLVDGRFVKAPTKIRFNHSIILAPRPETLVKAGYKLLVIEPYPEEELPDNFYYEMYYEEDEHNIYRKWRSVEIVDEES